MYLALGVTTLALRAHRARRLRDAHRRRGHRLRRDRDRGGGAAGAGRRRLHDDGDRGAARHGVVGQRDPVRVGGLTASLPSVGQFPPFFGRGSRSGRRAGCSSPPRSCSSSRTSSTSRRSRRSGARAHSSSSCSSDRGVPAARGDRRSGRRSPCSQGWRRPRSCSRFFAVDTLRNAPQTLAAIVVNRSTLAVVLDLVWKWVRDRGRRAGWSRHAGRRLIGAGSPLRRPEVT